MKRFLISEEEKQRILGMHQDATKRHYLNEQGTDPNKTTGDTDKSTIYNKNISKINEFFPVNLIKNVDDILTYINTPGITEKQMQEKAQPWLENNGTTIQFMTDSPTIPNYGSNYSSRFRTPPANSAGNYKSAVNLVLNDVKTLYYGLVAKAQEAKGMPVKYPDYFKTPNGKSVLDSYVKKAGLTV